MSLADKIAAKRQAITDKNAGMVRAHKFPSGKSVIRILPGVQSAEDFFQEVGIHWIKNKAGETVCAVGDRTICYGEPCPVRDSINALIDEGKEAGDDALIKRGKDMLAKPRFFVNGVFLAGGGDTKKNETVLLEFSENFFNKVLSIMQDYIEAGVDPLSLKDGVALVVEKTGSGLDTEYSVSAAPKNFGELPASLLDKRTDLEAFKRSQFDHRAAQAIAAISKELGRPLDAESIGKLMSPAGGPARIAGPAETSKPTASATPPAKVEKAVEAEFSPAPPSKAAPKVDEGVDDILAQLENL